MKREGFTLLELIVTAIIIGILASLSVPQFVKGIEKSRQAEAIDILTKMYRGYKIAIIDEVICLPAGNFCNGTTFSPEESDYSAVNPYGYSQPSWAALGFESNANNIYNTSYFTYQALLPNEYIFVNTPTGRYTNTRPTGSNSAIIGVAYRKTSNTRQDYSLFPIDTARWIYINLTTGAIGKSSHYQ
ncbi:MAG: type II secretion system protein [Candidatus Omnitrophica bacterium]|nr:type II secretion system protein [Candidatus Omnitrophota bacterium]MDD5352717.1 type II secretion system protein [Candidatus Omnitrophota bacterium]MDD5550316.1 type II secretion system protein [Candidatus Omnitrophota bacterium]